MLQILRHAQVFAPTPLGVVDLVVAADRILWIGKDLPALDDRLVDSEVDLGQAMLIPGLIDCHVHLTGGGGEAGPASRVPPISLTQLTGGGTTSVVGVLGTDDLIRSTASLVATSRSLSAEGISAWCLTGGYHLPPATLTGSVRGDIVHIDRVIGVGEIAISDHRSSQPSPEDLLRVAADAHVAGLMSGKAGLAHLHMGDGERGLDLVRQCLETSELPSRVFHPTHVNRRRPLFEEALRLAERGCCIDVTAFPEGDDEELTAVAAFESFRETGLPAERLTISSDAGGSLPTFDESGRVSRWEVGSPQTLSRTIRALLERGHAMDVILPPFTSNVADLFRLSGKGRIQVGAAADLVALDEDGEVTDVMALGRWHIRHGQPVIKGTFE